MTHHADSSPVTELHLDAGLAATLQLVTDTITASLGFDVAAMNLIFEDELMVVAVSGREDVRAKLLGARQPLQDWQRLLAASDEWGRLRFLDHRKVDYSEHPDFYMWVPDIPVSDDPEAWHPDDALFAPLSGASGELLGMLSVDMPRSGRRPGPEQRQALEAFGVTASLAVEHASLALEAGRGHRRFQAVFDSSPIPIALLGPDRCYLSVNAAFCRFLQRPEDALIGRDPEEFTHPEDIGRSRELSDAVRNWDHGTVRWPADDPAHTQEKRYRLPDGQWAWGRLHLAPLSDDIDSGIIVAQVEDITARKLAEERLRRQAQHDALTGLPNRAETLRRLRLTLRQDATAGLRTAVFFCDLDRFKWLNDTHGHTVGDAFLQEIARRLSVSVRGADTVGRLGGDEFVVVLSGVRTEQEVSEIAERVLAAVRQPWQSGPYTFTPFLSVGIACPPAGSAGADDLLAQADLAMYHAKTRRDGSWAMYHPGLEQTAIPRFQLRADLPSAFAESQLVLYYQPIVALPDRSVIGHEALLRWQHPSLGLLAPAQFLDLVLDSEFEAPVTDWVIRHACLQAAARGPRHSVAVNVGPTQFARPDFVDVVRRALEESDLAPHRLVLEVTEDRLLPHSDICGPFEQLRSLGVGLALDDFGSGYAGLQYLHRYPHLTALKLDRSFTAELGTNPTSEKIVRSAVALARDCDLTLVVEGVETDEQVALLVELGAPFAQGYRFGRPKPIPVTAAGSPPTRALAVAS